MLDLYGLMIRNNQKMKDMSPAAASLKKAKSNDDSQGSTSGAIKKSGGKPLPKVVVKKDKLIFKFLKSSKKEELQKLKEELKSSI
jgi:hypothetical protein